MSATQTRAGLAHGFLIYAPAAGCLLLYPSASHAQATGLLAPIMVMPWVVVFWVLWSQALLGILIWIVRGVRARELYSIGGDPSVNSYLSESVDEESPEEHSEHVKILERPDKWSVGLIGKLEWRMFEKLCIRVSRLKGNSVEENSNNRGTGVDFYLLAKDTNVRIGAVRCKNWHGKPIELEPLVELQRTVNKQKLHVGLLMYHGELSERAEAFLARPEVSIKVRNSIEILKQISALSERKQAKLLQRTTKGAYTTPSCPNCDVKLVMKIGEATGVKFMVCPNAPSCVFSMSRRKAPVVKVAWP